MCWSKVVRHMQIRQVDKGIKQRQTLYFQTYGALI